MNWIDRTIAAVSPAAAFRRERYRLALKGLERFSYDGARTGRRLDGWSRAGTSANAETAGSLKALRDGARDLVRNNPLAAKAVAEYQTRAVGTGIVPQARTSDERINKLLDNYFDQWSKQCTSDGQPYWLIQSLAARAIVEGGEAVLRHRVRYGDAGPQMVTPRGKKVELPYQVQLLEGDFLDHNKTQEIDTGYIVQGVEHDKIGRRVAYWLFASHPGDTVNTGWFRRGMGESARVPAETNGIEGVTHGYRVDRASQDRGVTWFAPVITAMHDLDGYQDAERVRKRTEACLVATVQPPVNEQETAAVSPTRTTDSNGNVIEELAPGMIIYTPPGSGITMTTPHPAQGTSEYVTLEQRILAAGLLMPFEILTGNLSQINYSSYRGGLIGYRGIIEHFQWLILIPFICDSVWMRFVDACKIAGLVPEETTYEVEWSPPPFDLLDRQAEADADEKEIRIGTQTLFQAIGKKGYDPKKQLQQIADINELLDKLKIILDCDPRKITARGAQQPNAQQKEVPIAQPAAA